jgi:hypothetical protein
MASIADLSFDTLAVAPFKSGNGPRTANIVDGKGQKVHTKLGDVLLSSPFGASAFDKTLTATRLTLEFVVSGALLEHLQRLDKWVVQYCSAHAAVLFPEWAADDIGRNYHSFLKFEDKYTQWRARTKISTAGLTACRFWGADMMPIPFEDVDTKASGLLPFVQISGLWQQGRQYGLTLLCTDIQVRPAAAAVCPFGILDE